MTHTINQTREDQNEPKTAAEEQIGVGEASQLARATDTQQKPAERDADDAVAGEGTEQAAGPGPEAKAAEAPDSRVPQPGASHDVTRRSGPVKAVGASASPRISKSEAALKHLRRKSGASLAELQETTGWQVHSVRGFLSGTVRKKMALELSSEVTKQGVRRYHVNVDAKAV
ncbi:DUF3489 domain-containing protein [Pelagibacterium montanilacus]|uniref:DUF3489 domain-containing protein n=1 Tax=Pelagibacterium montanilacus TaxID=2185280 RepID=UPI000F8D5B13|nr:DUF3489 domain-containing protein [Pelagibacterium montanilacus]